MDAAYIKASELAKLCKVNTWTVYRWIRTGIVKAVTLPTGTIRIPVKEAERIVGQKGKNDEAITQ